MLPFLGKDKRKEGPLMTKVAKNPKKVEKEEPKPSVDPTELELAPETAPEEVETNEELIKLPSEDPKFTKEENELHGKLSRVAATLSRQFGQRSMLYLREHPDYAKVQSWIPTGNYSINWICSGRATGGIPAGRVIDLYGDPSCGKSLMLAHILAETQKLGGIAVLYDVEATFDRMFGERIGLDWADLLYTKAYRLEKKDAEIIGTDGKVKKVKMDKAVGASVQRLLTMLDEAIDLLHYEFPDRLVTIGVDSVSNLTTEHELDVGVEKKDLSKAGSVRQMMRMLEGKMSDLNITLVVTNHITANIDANPFARRTYGPKQEKSAPGGSGIPFASSIRLDLTRGHDVTVGKFDVIGHEIKVHTFKNKVFASKKTSYVEMFFDKGLDPLSGFVDFLVAKDIVEELGDKIFRYKGKRFKRHKMHPYPGFDEMVDKYPELLTALDEIE